MNDFTKYELQSLLWAVNYVRDHTNNCGDVMRRLKTMLEDMTNNCCQHESDGYVYYKNGIKCTDFPLYACSQSPCLLKCKKCSELFDEGNNATER